MNNSFFNCQPIVWIYVFARLIRILVLFKIIGLLFALRVVEVNVHGPSFVVDLKIFD